MPSAPIERDKNMRYKNPKNFSHIENVVTAITVLRKVFIIKLLRLYSDILFARKGKYNIVMENFFYRVQKGDSLVKISRRFNQSVFSIIKENNLIAEVEEGDVLLITSSNQKLVALTPLDDAYSLSRKHCIPKDTILMQNGGVPYLFYGIEVKV